MSTDRRPSIRDATKSICGRDINSHLAQLKFIASINITSRCCSKRTMMLPAFAREYGGPYKWNGNARNAPRKRKKAHNSLTGAHPCHLLSDTLNAETARRIIIVCLINANADISGFSKLKISYASYGVIIKILNIDIYSVWRKV